MSDVKNVITLGIGAAPGNIRYFVLLGLDTSTPAVNLTLRGRPNTLTLKDRSAALTLRDRSTALTMEDR